MAKVIIGFANDTDENNRVVLEISGSNDWVKETMTCVHGLFDSIGANSPFDIANAEEAQQELRDAFAMAQDGNSYTGQIVTTHITITDDDQAQAQTV